MKEIVYSVVMLVIEVAYMIHMLASEMNWLLFLVLIVLMAKNVFVLATTIKDK